MVIQYHNMVLSSHSIGLYIIIMWFTLSGCNIIMSEYTIIKAAYVGWISHCVIKMSGSNILFSVAYMSL